MGSRGGARVGTRRGTCARSGVRAITLAAVLLLAACGPAGSVAVRGASPSASPARQPATLPSASAARTVRTFVDRDMGFRLDLPEPWRPSSCNEPPRTDGGIYIGRADFVVVDELHETSTDVGHQYASIEVTVTDNKGGLTPREWIEMGKIGTTAGTALQDVRFAGGAAVQLVPGGTYVFADKGRMWAVGTDLHADPSLKSAADAVTASFGLLSDDEVAAARLGATPSPAPRGLDDVINGLAAAFARKDADALATLMSDCFGNAVEKAGATFVTRAKELADLRTAFTSGWTVAVAVKPVKGDASLGSAAIGSTWSADGQPARSIDLSLREDAGRWRWVATIRLQH